MYHALLTNRYLTSRVIPLIAVAAVALCVALVIVVVSVMTGFLNMVKSSGRTLMGDVVVSYSFSGIPHYQRLIDRILQLPEAAAATPVVDGLGLLRMPYPQGPDKSIEGVSFWGIEPISFAQVTGYEETLYWKELTTEQWNRLFGDVLTKRWSDVLNAMSEQQRIQLIQQALKMDQDEAATQPSEQEIQSRLASMDQERWRRLFSAVRTEPDMLKSVLTAEQWTSLLQHDERLLNPGRVLEQGLTLQRGGDNKVIVLGMHVSEANRRRSDGTYEQGAMGYWWMPRFEVLLQTIPTSGGLGDVENVRSKILQVVNEFVSGVFVIDDKRVMIPIEIAQEMLRLDAGQIMDENDPTVVKGPDPARATLVLVRAKEGVTPEQLREAVENAYMAFWDEIDRDETAVVKPPSPGLGLNILTWLEQQAQFIGPVEKERELMRTIFSVVYVVCAALVLSIFWAIVYEKTRDIGILRSIGASRSGIVWIFLRYGLVVGVIGSIVGLGLAFLVTHNINGIHHALAEPPLWLGITILALGAATVATTIALSLRGALLPLVVGSLVSFVFLALGTGI
ncbi:MAG: hypothetical protein L0Y42_05245, partial [Phycisphaerales bacterium]|nr:hypothetical protein [Phycisphaerales bacterium]